MRLMRHGTCVLVLSLLCVGSPTAIDAQQALFRASAERVTVAVVARDEDGRPIRGLSAKDFRVTDDGEAREILDFRNDLSPVSVALLVDSSGSMHGEKLEQAHEVGHFLLASMKSGSDEAALFAFDKIVQMAHPFSDDLEKVRSSFALVKPWGETSLYDAIAETAQQLSSRAGRRAVVVLTDGVDTSSRLTPQEVSGIASAIDMPVYIVAVQTTVVEGGELTYLAQWSGGMFYTTSNTSSASVVARQIINELRHQYLIAFESRSSAGWHRIEVQSRQRAALQARSGYWVGPSPLNR